MTNNELTQALQQFCGSQVQYRLYPNLIITEGVKFLCEEAHCYWLMDVIWSYQTYPAIRNEVFQVYTLLVDLATQEGQILCTDGNEAQLFNQKLPFTDFPLESLTLYYTDQVVMLPGEY